MKNIYTILQKITIPLIITLLIITVYSSFKRSSLSTEQPTNTEKPFIPLTNEPIMGYWFSEPQKVPNTGHEMGFQIIEWLDDSETVLLHGASSLEVVNITKDETTLYATVKSRGNIDHPTWITALESVAYLTLNFEAKQQELWLGKANKPPELLLKHVESPLVLTKDGTGINVYNKNKQALGTVWLTNSKDNEENNKLTNLLEPRVKEKTGSRTVVKQPRGEVMAYYDYQRLWLLTPSTGKSEQIDINNHIKGPLIWIIEAKWSPDGRWLAMLMGESDPPITASYIYLFDLDTSHLDKMEIDFRYITELAWAPDSQHLLFMPVVSKKDGVNVENLYITNILNLAKFELIPIPTEGLASYYGGGLSWSPNGERILLTYYDGQEMDLYQIKVSVP